MAQEGTMPVTSSRRDVLNFGCGTAAAIGVSAVATALGPVPAAAQGASASNPSAEDFFYREDWFGEPWRKPETAVLIHGNAESSIVWYAWMPRMGQEFRVVRPDLPGLGRSRIPAGSLRRSLLLRPGRALPELLLRRFALAQHVLPHVSQWLQVRLWYRRPARE